MGNPDYVRDYARLNTDTLGHIPGVTFQTPHGDPGAPYGAGMKLPSGEYVTEKSFAPRILREMQRHKKELENQKDSNYKPEANAPIPRRIETEPPPDPNPKPKEGGEIVAQKREDIPEEVPVNEMNLSNDDIGKIAKFLAGTPATSALPTQPQLSFGNIKKEYHTPLDRTPPLPSHTLAPLPRPPPQTPIDPK